jgi:hypothetical protein
MAGDETNKVTLSTIIPFASSLRRLASVALIIMRGERSKIPTWDVCLVIYLLVMLLPPTATAQAPLGNRLPLLAKLSILKDSQIYRQMKEYNDKDPDGSSAASLLQWSRRCTPPAAKKHLTCRWVQLVCIFKNLLVAQYEPLVGFRAVGYVAIVGGATACSRNNTPITGFDLSENPTGFECNPTHTDLSTRRQMNLSVMEEKSSLDTNLPFLGLQDHATQFPQPILSNDLPCSRTCPQPAIHHPVSPSAAPTVVGGGGYPSHFL